jgi:hypothetical protein
LSNQKFGRFTVIKYLDQIMVFRTSVHVLVLWFASRFLHFYILRWELDMDVKLYPRVSVRFCIWLSNMPAGTNDMTETAFKDASLPRLKWFDWQKFVQRWRKSWRWTMFHKCVYLKHCWNRQTDLETHMPLYDKLVMNCWKSWQDLNDLGGGKKLSIVIYTIIKIKMNLCVYRLLVQHSLLDIVLVLFTPTTCFDLHTRPSSGGYIQVGPCYTCH